MRLLTTGESDTLENTGRLKDLLKRRGDIEDVEDVEDVEEAEER